MKKIVLAILAAGASQRFGSDDKLMALWRGKPLLAQTLATYHPIPLTERFAIVRKSASPVAELCRASGYQILENNDADSGIASSIVLAANDCCDADGLMIALGDMPSIKRGTVNALITAFESAAPNSIVAPTSKNRRGHPVIFSTDYLPELKALHGDHGAGEVIEEYNKNFVAVPVDDAGIFIDFDRPDDFDRS